MDINNRHQFGVIIDALRNYGKKAVDALLRMIDIDIHRGKNETSHGPK